MPIDATKPYDDANIFAKILAGDILLGLPRYI